MNTIESLYKEWLSLQPLKGQDRIRLEQKFMLEFNYNSNHIEGNTLTYGQTEMLLLFDKVVENASMRDLEEMKASNVGLNMVKVAALDKEQHLTEYFIRTLHKTLLRGDYTVYRQLPDGTDASYIVHAGQYKTRPNSVITPTGERFEYASPEETPALMADLLKWYNEAEAAGKMSPIELASLFHYRYIRIHPFEDGNGRISRLIVNYILCRHGYPMIVVKSSDKSNYLTALNRCDLVLGPTPSDGAQAELSQITPFVDYLSKCLERALNISIKAAKGESIEEADDFEKQLKIIERNTKYSKDVHIVTTQDKIDVYENFHKHLKDRLINELQPAFEFYNTHHIYYGILQNRSSVKVFTTIRDELDFSNEFNNARGIVLTISLSEVKHIYKLQDVPIKLDVDVLFESQYYLFYNCKYKYGTYPTQSEIDNYVKDVKDYVLKIIQKATEETL